MTSTKEDDAHKDASWVNFTGDLFSASTANWGTICGDQSQVVNDSSQNAIVAPADLENPNGPLNKPTQLHNTAQNAPGDNGAVSNSYLPSAYNCDGSDYGEILVNEDAHDAISTVTPATFAQTEQRRRMGLDAYNRSTHTGTVSIASDGDVKLKRRRKYLIGAIIFVSLVLVVIVVAVPIVVTKKSRAGQVSNVEVGLAENMNNDDASSYQENSRLNGESSASDSPFKDENPGVEQVGQYSEEPAVFDTDDEPSFQTSQSVGSEATQQNNEDQVEVQSQSIAENLPNIFQSETGVADEGPQLIEASPPPPANSPTGPINTNGSNLQARPAVDSSGNTSSSVQEPTVSYNDPAPVSTPTNNHAQNQPSTMISVAETSPPTYTFAEDTPVPTYLFATPAPQLPTLEPTQFTNSIVRISLQTDKQGYETSWSLESVGWDTARSTNSSTVIAAVHEHTYDSYEKDSKEFTLSRGTYRFTLKDAFGDGFYSKDFKGYYSITIDGREVIKGGYFRSEIAYEFLIGYFPAMTQREKEWLIAHNVRRKEWHEGHGVSYVPLRWSAALAKQAQSWANKLTDACEVVGIEHEHGVMEGENLAKNQAGGKKGMGRLYPPENILRRWVDYEADLPNPHNLHLTQALWRASKYVGCADALREDEDGSVCRIQVCRYVNGVPSLLLSNKCVLIKFFVFKVCKGWQLSDGQVQCHRGR